MKFMNGCIRAASLKESLFGSLWSCRSFATTVFDRELKRRHRARSLLHPDGEYYDYLRKEAARRLVDRLRDITRTLPVALELGSYRQHVMQEILSSMSEDTEIVGGIKTLVQSDVSDLDYGAYVANNPIIKSPMPSALQFDSHAISLDEESLPFKPESFDLVLSSLSLHWVNDLPKTFEQIKAILKPDGAFVGSMLGGTTLHELRHCIYLAEQERRGGISPHTSPFARPSDIAGILQAADFALPTVDIDTITIGYPNAFVLMEHIQQMGEGNANWNRQLHIGSETMIAAATIYQQLYQLEDGSIPATFQLISMIGWKPDPTKQPKACQRGSAQHSLKDLGDVHS